MIKTKLGFPLPTAILLPCLLLFSACQNQQDQSKPAEQKPSLPPLSEVPMVHVPAGEFIRGSNKTDKEGMQQRYGFPNPLYLDERPQSKIHLDGFYIDKYEVSNAQYKEYIQRSKGMMPFEWLNNGYALGKQQLENMQIEKLRSLVADFMKLDIDTRKMDQAQLVAAALERQKKLDSFPVGNVSWFNAEAYCQWRGGRLPTEAEWEKAARGTKGQEYPWGDNWDPKITNTGDDGEWEEGVAPVGKYPGNKSPYGAYDMSGNVWEWVADWYDAYPGSEYESPLFGKEQRVIRGGGGGVGHYAISYFFRAATRQYSEPGMENPDVGFRCAKDAS